MWNDHVQNKFFKAVVDYLTEAKLTRPIPWLNSNKL